MSLLTLQHYWFFIVALLAALLVFLTFVQGGQTLIYQLGKTEMERTMIVNTLGRKWELTFTTLVTFGGAFFASFPLFYSTSFGGAYWVWMAILFAFVIQAVSYEYRSKASNLLGQRTYDVFLFLNGLLGTVLLGTAVGTFFTGSQFQVEKLNLTNLPSQASTVISQWTGPAHGLEAVLTFTNVALGLAVFFLSRILGALYIMNSVKSESISERARKELFISAPLFLLFFLWFLVSILLRNGFAVNPDNGIVYLESYKYLHNFLQMPLVLILFLAGVVLVLTGLALALFKKSSKGIWYSGTGTVLAVLSLLLVAGYNHTAFYPAVNWSLGEGTEAFDKFLQSSLTIQNSSSSHYTLTVMSYVSLLVPFVLAYIAWVWKSLNNKQVSEEEMKEDIHVY
ncbi:MAG: cytochrome bd ubiquinol oxidase subunit [Bacteroidales bacterium]|nr:cytochrome bd ubiquinol oxidase subunit [Bacteroidales bacterium]MDN5330340.1 cytochrome bd ubiquinol oxidase subunit [Bacteroidales bacterium]